MVSTLLQGQRLEQLKFNSRGGAIILVGDRSTDLVSDLWSAINSACFALLRRRTAAISGQTYDSSRVIIDLSIQVLVIVLIFGATIEHSIDCFSATTGCQPDIWASGCVLTWRD